MYNSLVPLFSTKGLGVFRIICGMTSGAVAQFCASPTDLVKVRMQMEGQKILRGGVSGRPKTMMQTFGDVLAAGGFFGLWKGCVPNVQRAALVNLGDLTGYDQAKRMLCTGKNIGNLHTNAKYIEFANHSSSESNGC